MSNKMNAAKKRVQKNDKSRFERIVRHRQTLEREKYVEKAIARTCNIYFVCFIIVLILVVAGAIWVFANPGQNMLFLSMNAALGVVFAPLCIYQYNNYHHIAAEVAKARTSSGFRFPEDYSPRTRKAREGVSKPARQYATSALTYGTALIVVVVVFGYLYATDAFDLGTTMSLLLTAAVVVASLVLLVMFLMALLNYFDAKSLVKELIRIEEEAEAEFAEELSKRASKYARTAQAKDAAEDAETAETEDSAPSEEGAAEEVDR